MSDFDKIIALQRRLQGSKEEAKRGLEGIEQQLQAVTMTLDLLRKENQQAHASPEGDLLAELRTKSTQVPALVAIAKHNGGILLTKDAKSLLQRAGLMKATKNASNILYNVINRSERFDHVGPGRYRLKVQAVTTTKAVESESKGKQAVAVQ